MLREQGGMGWGAQHHPRMFCVCVCSGPCQGLPSQKGSANCSCPGTGAKPGVRSRPADPAQRQRRRRGFGAEQVALVGVNAWLVQPASLRAALSRQLRQGGKRSWKKNLPENCQTVIHFSETTRLCLDFSYLFTKSSLSGADFRRILVVAAPGGVPDPGVASLPFSDTQHFLCNCCLYPYKLVFLFVS